MRLCAQEAQGQKSGDPQLSNGESRKIAEEGRLWGLPPGRPGAERRRQGKPRSRPGACANSCKKTRSPDSRGAQETREHRTEATEVGGPAPRKDTFTQTWKFGLRKEVLLSTPEVMLAWGKVIHFRTQ